MGHGGHVLLRAVLCHPAHPPRDARRGEVPAQVRPGLGGVLQEGAVADPAGGVLGRLCAVGRGAGDFYSKIYRADGQVLVSKIECEVSDRVPYSSMFMERAGGG